MASYIVINKDKLREICLSTQEKIDKENIKQRQEFIDHNLKRLKNYNWFNRFLDKIFSCTPLKTKEDLENYWNSDSDFLNSGVNICLGKKRLINSMLIACNHSVDDNINISVKDLYEVSKF